MDINTGQPQSARSQDSEGATHDSVILGSHGAKSVDLETVKSLWHLPIETAAKQLGVCTTILKRCCRVNGIKRWPYRQLAALQRRMNGVPDAVMTVLAPTMNAIPTAGSAMTNAMPDPTISRASSMFDNNDPTSSSPTPSLPRQLESFNTDHSHGRLLQASIEAKLNSLRAMQMDDIRTQDPLILQMRGDPCSLMRVTRAFQPSSSGYVGTGLDDQTLLYLWQRFAVWQPSAAAVHAADMKIP
eukprot:TRINITY_DN12954_c0_g1_i1.p1 TRINITY_DN12954_c0_g1~~TRINITY_DN12954_c0_g1_i1.p1  ORF type:complete len:243 (+),score=31.88 TRINITY_DN12954_c0_g1_i1:71-799(+)